MLRYLSKNIVCSEEWSVFQEHSLRKPVNFEEQIIILQIFFSQHVRFFKTGEYSSDVLYFLLGNMQSCDAFRPIANLDQAKIFHGLLLVKSLVYSIPVCRLTINCGHGVCDTLLWILLSSCTAIPRPSRSIVLWTLIKPFETRLRFMCWFFSPLFLIQGLHARTTRVLLFMVIPGNLIFLYTIRVLQAGHTTLTLIFTSGYLMAGLIQVFC